MKPTNKGPQNSENAKIGIPEIAELANVSIGTVDRALHARKGVSEATRKRVLQIAKQCGIYAEPRCPDALGRDAQTLRSAFAIPREAHFFYDQLRDGILDESRRFESMGVEVHYRPIDKLGVGECERVKEMLETGVSAMIITPGDPHCLQSADRRSRREKHSGGLRGLRCAGQFALLRDLR